MIVTTPLCLENISKDFSVDNMKKTGLNEYVYDFTVDYDAIAVDDILDIHKYLWKRMAQYRRFGCIKKVFVVAVIFFSFSILNINPLECVSVNNQE